jgi:hypothetical protein
MSLERLCLEQEEIIEKQAAQIRDLLTELMQFRALSEEEARIASTIPGKEGAHLWK